MSLINIFKGKCTYIGAFACAALVHCAVLLISDKDGIPMPQHVSALDANSKWGIYVNFENWLTCVILICILGGTSYFQIRQIFS
jgi:hypothetical protein